MKKSAVLAFFLFSCTFLWAQDKKVLLWDTSQKERYELMENIQEFGSTINWTTGKVRIELHFPIGNESANMGRNINNNNTMIRDELRQSLIKAMGYLRISDVFLLKDYYSMKSDVRYEIIALADRAFYYPVVQKNNELVGIAELDLYGQNGIASIFNRDVDHRTSISSSNYQFYTGEPDEYFDGLIIDADSTFQPSLQMRIFDEDGTLLYGPETIDRAFLEKNGVCEYVTTLKYAFASSRVGNKIYYTLPYKITGEMKNNFVLKNEDAVRIFSNPKTRRLINQGRVVINRNQD